MVDFDLRGKEWLTEAEAAHYCGVSLRHFQDHARRFRVRRFLGRKLYARAELFDAINSAPLWYQEANAKLYFDRETRHAELLARITPERKRPYKPRKKPI